jgi:hypothetical protein
MQDSRHGGWDQSLIFLTLYIRPKCDYMITLKIQINEALYHKYKVQCLTTTRSVQLTDWVEVQVMVPRLVAE